MKSSKIHVGVADACQVPFGTGALSRLGFCSRCASLLRNVAFVMLTFAACCAPNLIRAQMVGSNSSLLGHPTDSFAWITPNQQVLRLIALDTKRQQIVIRIDAGELKIVKRGEPISQFSLSFLGVSGNTANFKPLSGSGSGNRGVEQISITRDGETQYTEVLRLSAPPRTNVSTWGVAH